MSRASLAPGSAPPERLGHGDHGHPRPRLDAHHLDGDHRDADHLDPGLPITERVEALLGTMTLREKLAQLSATILVLVENADPAASGLHPVGGVTRVRSDVPLAHGIGQLTRPFGHQPVDAAEGVGIVNAVQRHLVEHTRLGIPAMVHEECLTGLMAWGATTFPCPLALASTWDVELVQRVGTAIHDQLRAVGVHQGLAPVLDVVRDARWGRVEECLGEDPLLAARLGLAYILGLQGPAGDVAATAKHFAGHSAAEGGRNLAPVHVGDRELADVFLPPFETAVLEGSVRCVMNAYHDRDGIPVAADASLLTGLLRDTWGFGGLVVSDYDSVAMLQTRHGVAHSPGDAAAQALRAGIDVDLPHGDCYLDPLESAVLAGAAAEADVDRAVRRVLTLKFELGLFDDPYVAPPEPGALDAPAHRAMAREAAVRSLVLLRNHNDLLPIDGASRSVAVIGPNAAEASCLMGNYSFRNHVLPRFAGVPSSTEAATVLEALRAALGGSCAVIHERGCEVTGDDRSGFEAAVAAASSADCAVLVLGDQPGHFGAGTSGEGSDADDLALPGVQGGLLRAVAATGTPLVLVLVAGRPYDLSWAAENVDAILACWLPGDEGGTAIAEVLTGVRSPAGRTPVTFSRGAGQQPLHYNRRALSTGSYGARPSDAVFAFGHGLTYSRVAYGALELESATVPIGGTVRARCTLANTGGRPVDEVVQLYSHDPVASTTRPGVELVGFARIGLDPGEEVTVEFDVPTDVFSFTDASRRRIVEAGTVELRLGASSVDIRSTAAVELEGATAVLDPRLSRRVTRAARVIQPSPAGTPR